MCARKRGVTLTEVLVASSVAAVAILWMGTMDVSRVHREQSLRQQMGTTSHVHDAALASLYFARAITQANRFNLIDPVDPVTNANPTILQLRRYEPTTDAPLCAAGDCTTAAAVPKPCCFHMAANYQWDQYQLNSSALEWYRDTRNPADGSKQCGSLRVLAREVTALTFQYKDVAPAPEGGEPDSTQFPAAAWGGDTNTIEYAVTWSDGGAPRTFAATVSSMAIPYSDLTAGSAGPGDSGWGVDLFDVSPPPGRCP